MRRKIVPLASDGTAPDQRRKLDEHDRLIEGRIARAGDAGQRIGRGESPVSSWPSAEDFDRGAVAIEQVLHNDETRAAWLMGFLTGSALAGDAEWPTKLKLLRKRPFPRGG